jgi:PilZ domain
VKERWRTWGGRVLVAGGLVALAGYLTWRVGWSWQGTRWWLFVPMLVVELVGAAGSMVLAWAFWNGTEVRPQRRATTIDDVAVMIRAEGHGGAEVRATLLAVRRAWGITSVHVATRHPSAALAQAAADHHAELLTLDAGDPAALAAAVGVVEPWVLLLDAGDIIGPDLVVRLADAATEDVAVVQATVVAAHGDSAEHQADGTHELRVERSGLLPALGQRGLALITESGSLVRRSALAAVAPVSDHREIASWRISTALWREGWQITTAGTQPLVVRPSRHDAQSVIGERAVRAAGARRLVFGRGGALRGRWTVAQRMAMLAWSVRPLSGFRRTLFMLTVGGALLAGRAPFHMRPVPLVLGFLTAFVCLPLGISLLSDGALRPGDRTRWSLRALGPAWRSLALPTASSGLPVVARVPVFADNLAPAVVVGLVSTVVAMRGISERLTGALHDLPQGELVVLLLAALWLLAMALDSLRLLGRGRTLRRSVRREVALPAEIGTTTGYVVDVSSSGIGVVMAEAPHPGHRLVVHTSLPATTGCTTLELPAIVRHVRRDIGGQWLVGAEFDELPPTVADAVAEYTLLDPALDQLDDREETHPRGVSADALLTGSSGRSAALRTLALSGVAGALASVDITGDPGQGANTAGVVVVLVAAALAFGVVLGARRASG